MCFSLSQFWECILCLKLCLRLLNIIALHFYFQDRGDCDEDSPAEIGLEECEILHEYLSRKLASLDGSVEL